MDPLTTRRLGTLIVFLISAAQVAWANTFAPVATVAIFSAGIVFGVGIVRFIDDRKVARDRDEVMERFLRPRFDKDTFGGWRSHGRRPGAGEADRR